ncbi:MAG: HD domain-containing protein [Acidobacteriota bacterium]
MTLLSIRDPVHGFIRADALETALINSRPVQRLRFIRQLGLTYMVYPGAEHSRFSHALGAMELAGRVYDALAAKSGGRLPSGADAVERRAVRAAALLHDVGHAPFSHSAEELFEHGIDHEEMTRRLIGHEEIGGLFERHGGRLDAGRVAGLVGASHDRTDSTGKGVDRLLAQVVSGELDVDKMDYLLRDGLFCGVRYGNYDLERLLDTIVPLEDPDDGRWGIGVDEGGVHALEALVLARYYMFTQVYFNLVSKALELHLSRWLTQEGWRWPADPEAFLAHDDVTVTSAMRASRNPHALSVTGREHFPLAFETGEHLTAAETAGFAELLPRLRERFGEEDLLESHSSKDPHRFGQGTLLVRRADGSTVTMERASHFIRHLERIDRYRIYARPEIRDAVEETLKGWWSDPPR